MEATIKIESLSDIDSGLVQSVLRDIVAVIGRVEITIKPGKELTPEILRRIKEVEGGAELICFSDDDFERVNEKLLAGEPVDTSTFKKVTKHETANHI